MAWHGMASCRVAEPIRSAFANARTSLGVRDRGSHMPHRRFSAPHHASRSALRWRMRRGCHNAKRLEYEASVLATVHGAVRLKRADELSSLLARADLGADTAGALRFRESGVEYDLVLPTDRTWNLPRLRRAVADVGLRASSEGLRILIVPPAEVRSQPRLANAQHIFHAKKVPACGDLDRLTRWMQERGSEAPLVACEAELDSPEARERIFGLVFGGHLAIDLASPMTDQSIVRLRARRGTSSWDQLGWCSLRTDRASGSTSSDVAEMELGSA